MSRNSRKPMDKKPKDMEQKEDLYTVETQKMRVRDF